METVRLSWHGNKDRFIAKIVRDEFFISASAMGLWGRSNQFRVVGKGMNVPRAWFIRTYFGDLRFGA